MKPAFIFSYVGVLGGIIFFLLRPSYDFHSAAPINMNRATATELAVETVSNLGLAPDTLESFVLRIQKSHLLREIKEDRGLQHITPFQLNRAGIPLNNWRVEFGTKYSAPEPMTGLERLFLDRGIARVEIGDDGRILTFRSHPERNHTFVEGESIISAANNAISEIFGYNASDYRLAEDADDEPIDLIEGIDVELPEPILEPEGELQFLRINQVLSEPVRLNLRYSFKEMVSNGDTVSGIKVNHFHAKFTTEDITVPSATAGEQATTWIVQIIVFVVMLLMVLIAGISQIFQRRVAWKRTIVVFVSVTLVRFIWQVQYLLATFYAYYPDSVVIMDIIQHLVISIFYGIYAALAYIAWESIARSQNSGQIPVVDSLWSGDLMKIQVGAGIMSGFGIAGFSLGIFAVLMFYLDSFFIQIDSFMTGFREPDTFFPGLSVIMNAWLESTLFTIAHVGLFYCLISFVTKKEVVRLLLSAVFAGITVSVLLPFFMVDIPVLARSLIYMAICIPIVLAYRYFGILSAFVAWFVLLSIIKILPYLGSTDGFIFGQSMLILMSLIIPLLLGFVSFRFGSITKLSTSYAPEYESEIKKQLRSEKELAIAKESQFALMPLSPPEVKGLDISGFFIPSYEVGGDFYDYTVINGENGEPTALMVAIVDVSGKAMKAAINAVFTSGLLLGRIQTDSPEGILSGINPIICKKTDAKTFITCQIGKILLKEKKLILANAGHCHPIIKRNGKAEYIEPVNPKYPLGVVPKVEYKPVEIGLEKGDVLLFFSDGLPEAMNKKGDRFSFGELRQMIGEYPTEEMTSQEICLQLKKFILEFSDYELFDDTTVVCVKVTE